jgi:hypothetical protein
MSDIYANREYLIFPVSELNKVDFSQVLETSADTVRKSVDETKTFVKWNGNAPAFVSTIVGAEGPYTHAEILDILSTSEWSSPMTGSIP